MKTFKISIAIMIAVFLAFMSFKMAEQKSEPAYAWITGSWVGDGFGGVSEEIWSSPSEDGTIMGAYRHFKSDGSLNFYEFLVLNKDGLQLKHFTSDLIGWEEKEDMITFEMIKYDENIIELKGLKYERISDDKMKISLRLKNSSGEVRTEVFNMKRK